MGIEITVVHHGPAHTIRSGNYNDNSWKIKPRQGIVCWQTKNGYSNALVGIQLKVYIGIDPTGMSILSQHHHQLLNSVSNRTSMRRNRV
jgi:hypothetical protein